MCRSDSGPHRAIQKMVGAAKEPDSFPPPKKNGIMDAEDAPPAPPTLVPMRGGASSVVQPWSVRQLDGAVSLHSGRHQCRRSIDAVGQTP